MTVKKSLLIKILLLTLTGLVLGCASTQPNLDGPRAPLAIEGEYVVGITALGEWCPLFSPGTPQPPCAGLPPGNYSINATTKTATLISSPEEDFCAKSGLADCSPNYIMETHRLPDDPLYPALWGMESINAPKAWDTIRESPEVIVSVIDTGLDCSHEEITCYKQFDAITNREEQTDDNGHGTHCGGTIAAIGNNGAGVSGVTWRTKLIAAKFLGSNGSGTLFNAIKAIDYSIENKANIISASWGCRRCYSKPLFDAIKRAGDAGILFVAAAGNNGVNNDDDPHYPSDYELDNIISVAALEKEDRLASFSNYGATSVDLAAPGVGIKSTWRNRSYNTISGTSMATPHVAGAAALIMAQGKGALATRSILLKSTRPLESLQGKVSTGGTLDIGAAVGSEEPKPCNKKKVRACRQGCKDSYRCKCGKQRRCKLRCKKEICP